MGDFKTERQFTTRQQKLIYEEVYFNNDMVINNYNPLTGYELKYPQFFTANPSQDKSIAPRRIKITPSAHQFRLCISFRDAQGQEHSNNNYFLVDILQDNSTQEILNYIREQSLVNDNGTVYGLRSVYDKTTGKLTFEAYNVTNMQQVFFKIKCPSYDDYKGFWEFLNQIEDPFDGLKADNNYNSNSMIYVAQYFLFNVWNRETLYVHASFSNSQYRYLCLSNEFWEKPTKIFYGNVNDNAFYVYFTTDGVNKIVPYYANKLIELSFVLRTQELSI